MEFRIEDDETFKISLFTDDDGPVLVCFRFKPFIREEIYNIGSDTIISQVVEEFKNLRMH